MPIWQIDPLCVTWEGEPLMRCDATWPQYNTCLGNWSEAKLIASAEAEEQRRFIFPGILPTAVRGLEVVDCATQTDFFQNLPACGGQVFLWSLYGAFDAALEANNETHSLRLFEASSSVSVRMRLAPSPMQLALDHLSFIDNIRIQSLGTAADSFYQSCDTLTHCLASTMKRLDRGSSTS